jgi:hypothetical protein
MPFGIVLLLCLGFFAQTVPRQSLPITNPFLGTWVANLAKSTLQPSSQFQGVTLQISATDSTVTLAADMVPKSGKPVHAAETFRTDGTETSGTLSPGVTLVAKWLGTHVLGTVATKKGQVFVVVVYQVSSDGNTLTSRSWGAAEEVIVYERK